MITPFVATTVELGSRLFDGNYPQTMNLTSGLPFCSVYVILVNRSIQIFGESALFSSRVTIMKATPKVYSLLDGPLGELLLTSDGESLTGLYLVSHKGGPEQD